LRYAMMRLAYLCAGILVLALAAIGQARANVPMAVPQPPTLDPYNAIPDDIQAEALSAYRKHAARNAFRGSEIVMVDYRKPSGAPRLYILNLTNGAVEAYYVAHGRGSDPGHTKVALRFSDAPTTGMSSVGAFRGLERYTSSENGPALRLAGLDPTNSNAYDRLIVFHTAGYFSPSDRRFGRSCGCFVVTREAMERVYGVLADGGFLYAGPASLHDATASPSIDCDPRCGSCNTPLIAAARKPRNTMVAAVEDSPRPPRTKPAPDRPRSVVFAAIVPRPKPVIPSERAAPAAIAGIPVPLAKPGLPVEPMIAMAGQADLGPVPLAKPDLRPSLGEAMADAVRIPDPEPGEIPVPAVKPDGLQQVAELVP
jgi:hypothetical protein